MGIKLRGKHIQQELVRSQVWSKSWVSHGKKIIDEQGDLPQVEILCVDMAQRRWIFLFNQVFKDADIFVLRDFDSEHLIWPVAKSKAVKGEKLSRILKAFQIDLKYVKKRLL